MIPQYQLILSTTFPTIWRILRLLIFNTLFMTHVYEEESFISNFHVPVCFRRRWCTALVVCQVHFDVRKTLVSVRRLFD